MNNGRKDWEKNEFGDNWWAGNTVEYDEVIRIQSSY